MSRPSPAIMDAAGPARETVAVMVTDRSATLLPTDDPTSTDHLLRIGEVARRAGVSTRTLRYYQELGLIDPTGHSPGGNRRYSEDDLARVMRIRELQLVMGFPLDRIGDVLSAEDRLDELRAETKRGVTTERRVEILREAMELNRHVRAQVEDRAAALEAFLGDLDEKADRYRSIAGELGVDLDERPHD